MYRNNYTNHKPEYALKRVNELISSATGDNADKEKRFALEQLHLVISGAKRKQWQKIYEPIMKRHLELCVELKDNRTAKDGLHQYRNMCQNVDPNSLENVIIHLMELAELQTTKARDKANKVALAAAAKISDLDQEETPESIMLSSMTEEGAKDRTDREVVVPWLKFLWETYRAILELLHRNAKLEKVYQKTCEKAFKFCLEYQRTLEFRRLCEMLRMHLSNLQRSSTQPAKGTRIAWEWTAEAIELHLQTRFSQLEVATSLELWNEGFRTVEDIYAIMQLGKKTPKPRLMATYYEKLTRIFWVSENYLFHAYAWYRYYSLCCECRKEMKAEEKSLQATCVLLAALCIPSIRDVDDPTSLLSEEEISLEKNQQMAMLLDFQANPTRQALLSEIISKGVLNEVFPELATLYNLLEVKFQPLTLVKELTTTLTAIKANPHISSYAIPLQRVIVLRLIQQLSRVYSAVKMQFVEKLLVGLDLTYCEVEKLIIDGIAKHQLQLRIDHSSKCLRFGAVVSAGPALESQLSHLSTHLNHVTAIVEKELVDPTLQEENIAKRKAFLKMVSEESEGLNAAVLERKFIIERRKEGFERLQLKKMDEEKKRKDAEEAARKREEDERLRLEETQRKDAKLQKLRETMDIEKTRKAIAQLGVNIDEVALQEMSEASRRQLLLEAQTEANKAKEEAAKRLADQAKRLDHITRALRMESAPLIVKQYAERLELEKKEYEINMAKLREKHRQEHAEALIEKTRLARASVFKGPFEESLIIQQKEAYEQHVTKLREDAIKEFKQRKIAKARRRKVEHDERLEEDAEIERERLEREEEELRVAEEQERLRRDREEEEIMKLEAERTQREKDRELEMERVASAAAAAALAAQNNIDLGIVLASSPVEEVDDDGVGWTKQGPSGRKKMDEIDRRLAEDQSLAAAVAANDREGSGEGSGSGIGSSSRFDDRRGGSGSGSGGYAAPRGTADRDREEQWGRRSTGSGFGESSPVAPPPIRSTAIDREPTSWRKEGPSAASSGYDRDGGRGGSGGGRGDRDDEARRPFIGSARRTEGGGSGTPPDSWHRSGRPAAGGADRDSDKPESRRKDDIFRSKGSSASGSSSSAVPEDNWRRK